MPAKKGNTNALKHGLYAAHFLPASQDALKQMPFDDLRQEIAALRFIGEKILSQLKDKTDVDEVSKLANSFINTTTAINTSMRTQALLQGTYNPLDDAIDQALGKFNPYENDSTPAPISADDEEGETEE